MSCDEKWTCQKWSCEELWWAVELCVLRLPRQALCLCTAGCQAKGSRGPAAATAPQLLQKALCTAPAMQKGSAEALCTAPARQKAAAGQRRPPRRSSSRKLCVLRLPRKREVQRLYVLRLPSKRQPRASGGHRAAAPPGSSVYCACHAKGKCGGWSADALCTAPARQKAAAGQRRPPRRSSSRKLCVLRLPRKREVQRLCVLRLPSKRQPRASGGHRAAAPPGSSVYCACHAKGKCGGSVYCACQAKGSRGPAAATAPQLCVLRLPGKRQPRASNGHRAAAPPGSSVYCACHAKGKCGGSVYCACHTKASRGPAAPTRAAAPPGGSVYCACHAKGSQGALCTAPATRKPFIYLSLMWTSGRYEKWGVRSGLVMSGVRSRAVMTSDVISEVWEVVWEVELWWVRMW